MIRIIISLLFSLPYSRENPFVFDNPGCPANAFCSKKAGEKRKEWFKYLDNLQGSSLVRAKKWIFFEKGTVFP